MNNNLVFLCVPCRLICGLYVWIPSYLLCCPVAQSCQTLCDPVDYSTPGFPVFHHLSEVAHTHICWVGDAIQPSHPPSSPSPPSILSSIRVFSNQSALCIRLPNFGASAPILPMNIQGWFPLGLTSLISLLPRGLSGVFSNTIVWNHQLFSTQPSLWSNFHIRTWLLEK